VARRVGTGVRTLTEMNTSRSHRVGSRVAPVPRSSRLAAILRRASALELAAGAQGRTSDSWCASGPRAVAHATTPSMSFTGIVVGTICVNLSPAVP
jgi:hypothetical protein